MTDFREEFKQLLENTFVSAKGSPEQIYKQMTEFLNKVISNMPDQLYRYRKLDSDNHALESFEKGTISLCKAKCFSDKYDSLIFVDAEAQIKRMKIDFRDALKYVIKSVKEKDPELRADRASKVCYYFELGMTEDEVIDKLIEEDLSPYLKDIRQDLKIRESRFRESEKTARIACFTESVQSKFMWDTYADGYRGFALEYNLKEFFMNCFNKHIAAYVFPIIYSREKPDLTLDESNYYVFEQAKKKGWLKKLELIRPFIDTNLLSAHKPFLYKDKEEYAHEREWRILYYNEKASEDFVELPDEGCLKAIYYGPDIKKADYETLHQIALNKGIKEYRVSIDDNSRKYGLKIDQL